jgi:hypothetical protein
MPDTKRPIDVMAPAPLVFDTDPCLRCRATGRYSARRCFACSGRGEVINTHGKAARARFDAVTADMQVRPTEVQIGDTIQYIAPTGYRTWRKVVAIDERPDGRVGLTVSGPREGISMGFRQVMTAPADARVIVRYDEEVFAYAINAALDGTGARIDS